MTGGSTDICMIANLFDSPFSVSAVPPSQPISIPGVNVGPTFVRIHWQAPSFRGIPAVSRYVITVTQANATAPPLTFFTTDATRDFNVTGLAPGTTYEFRVAAISEYEMIVGHSLPSDPGFADTTATGMCV